jgi:hypothetical protein
MTDDEINASIAEACGWTEVNVTHRSGRAPGASYVGSEFIPNYCTDLNAMHEAETHIPDNLTHIYANKIAKVTGAEDSCCLSFYCATARQRAEAFLRTLGKWKE